MDPKKLKKLEIQTLFNIFLINEWNDNRFNRLKEANGAGDWCIAFRKCHLGDAAEDFL